LKTWDKAQGDSKASTGGMIRAFTMENASGESKIKLEYDGQVIVSCIVPGSFEFVAEYPQWERESATLGRKKNKSEEEARRKRGGLLLFRGGRRRRKGGLKS